MAIDKPLYYDEGLVDPDADDIEIELPDFSDANIEMMEDGSALIGEEDESDPELPPIDTVPHSSNLVAYFEDDELDEMAENLITAWEQDNDDREEWKKIYAEGLDLLGMKNEERDEPFPGASGVNHPLLAEAVVQFQAQAYKELLPAGGPVLTKVLGDETPERLQQAARVQDFLNYQIMEVMEDYDDDMDQLLFYLPLGGSAFKKTYFDPIQKRAASVFITAEHVTVPYKAKDLKNSPRIVHDFYMDGNKLAKYQDSGFYSNVHLAKEITTRDQSEGDEKADEMHGIRDNSHMFEYDQEYLILEANIDLDHELLNDGDIVRPYILTVDKESGTVLAIRRNWAQTDEDKHKLSHFTHYKFLPGLGFYGFGLVHMIGGLTNSVTSILRQLIDAGTFANLPGGLKSKGMRVDGGDEPIQPGEWRDVDVAGGTVRENILPLPYKEPSAVLFQLLGALVDSGQRFASIADMNVGDVSGSQQQPVGTTIAMLERGTKVMSSIHKRLHKAQKHEFRILSRIIKDNLPDEAYPYAVQGAEQNVLKKDFDERVDVLPVSDPNIFSMSQRVILAQQQLTMAQAAPEIHNLREAYRRMYAAMGISDIETILQPEQKPQRITPIAEHRKVLMNQKLEAVKDMNHQAHIQAHLVMLKHPVVANNIEFSSNLIQDIMGHVAFIAISHAEKAKQQGQAVDPATIELELFNQLMPQLMPPQQEDPMVKLQERQLDITERFNQGKLSNEQLKAEYDKLIEFVKVASAEKIAENKMQVDMEDTVINARVDLSKEAARITSASQGGKTDERKH